MRRRRTLNGLAYGVLGSFVSRNNDVNGYWAIGQLYSFAREQGKLTVTLDLLAGKLAPEKNLFVPMIARYREMFFVRLAQQRISESRISTALLTIHFETQSAAVTAPIREWGMKPFVIRLDIKDVLGKPTETHVLGRCYPHDPCREMRSNRA